MKMSNFVIGIVLVALFATVLGGFYSKMASDNSVTTYDNSTMVALDKFDEINNLSKDMNKTLTTVQSGGVSDLIGGMLTSGYTVLKTTWASVGAFTSLASSGLEGTALGESTNHFRNTAILIGFLLVMFALIGILVKKNA